MSKGLLVFVLRDGAGYDCTNNGVSSRFNQFVLTGEGIEGPFEPSEDTPELKLVKRKFGNREYMHVEPVSDSDNKPWYMAGGNFVYTSDSRFSAVSQYPLSVHDRIE